jgi:two-component system sensor histidine kinase YesM
MAETLWDHLRALRRGRAMPLSLRQELSILTFALLFTVSGIICFSAYMIFRTTIIAEIGNARIDILKQIGERTRLIKSSLTTISNLYFRDDEIAALLEADIFEVDTYHRIAASLDGKARRYQVAFDELDLDFYIVIVTTNGFSYASFHNDAYEFKDAVQTLWFGDVLARKGDIHWAGSFKDFKETPQERYVFSAARVLLSEAGVYRGLLLVNMRERVLFETYQNALTKRNTIYIADEQGTIVSHGDERMLGLNYVNMRRLPSIFEDADFALIRKGRGTILFSHYKDPESLWTIFEEIPLGEILDPLRRVSYALVVIFMVCMLLSLLLSYIIARRVTQPLNDFCQSIENVRDGNLNVISDIRGWKELQAINDAFNQMIGEVNRLLAGIKAEERDKRRAELDFLQAQISPHFLYNTLFSIKCLVSMQKAREAEEMLSAFIDLIRMTFRGKEELVPLEEELEVINKYILIQKYRYGNAFDVSVDCGTKELRCMVPRLILQPLVENAIFHGVDARSRRGQVAVLAQFQDDELLLKVVDNGAGMDAARVEQVLSGNGSGQTRDGMIGIDNVRRRIVLHFGAQYGVRIASTPGEGTEVVLHLPIIS